MSNAASMALGLPAVAASPARMEANEAFRAAPAASLVMPRRRAEAESNSGAISSLTESRRLVGMCATPGDVQANFWGTTRGSYSTVRAWGLSTQL